MMPQECNYPITNKEMLSIIHTLEIWRHYLEGSCHQFEIWNDHANLKYFMQFQDLNECQAQWWQWLIQLNHDYIFVYKLGATNINTDALSRREDHMLGIEDDKGIVTYDPTKADTNLTS